MYVAPESIPTRMWDADKLLKVRNTGDYGPGRPLGCTYTLSRLELNSDLP
jgi:hypothetical protein